MANSKEAIAIVLDVGKSMCGDKNYFILEEAKRCISMIIQRKIFSESKDEIALLLFGISSENESQEKKEKNKHVTIARNLQPLSWDFLEYVKEIKGTSVSTDFCRDIALLTAIDLLQNAVSKKKITSRRILFISNFDGDLSSDKVDEIYEEMKKDSIDLNVIGPEAFPIEDIKSEVDEPYYEEKLSILKAQNDISKILYEVNGESYSFSDVRQALTYYQVKKKSPFAWNANLEIGELIIPISAYLKITEAKTEPWKKAYAFKPEARIEHRCSYKMNDESQTEVSLEHIIPAFRFGSTLVPFSDEDKRNMSYEPGEKGMKILGFTKSDKVQRYQYVGESTHYVFCRKNDECAGTRLAAFIKGLHDTKMVAITRYVYNQRSAPKLGLLFPKIKEGYEFLIFVPLPFLEDIRHFIFSPLDSDSKNIPTEEQLDAIDQLITDMDLTVPIDEDGEELLKPKNTVNPYLQRLFQCLEFRVLYPEKPLPEIEPHVEALVNPSPELLKRAEKSIKKIVSLFPLKKAEVKQKGAKSFSFPNGEPMESIQKQSVGDDSLPEQKFVPETSLIDAVTDKITEVGSINPVRDFQHLVNNKALPFDEICDQLMNVVFKYLKDGAQVRMYHSKILSICKEFRHASLKENTANKYNFFLTNLKNVLLECEEDLWNKMKSEKISLISNQEVPSSSVSVEEAALFLASPSLSENKEATTESMDIKLEDDDDDDLLDQL